MEDETASEQLKEISEFCDEKMEQSKQPKQRQRKRKDKPTVVVLGLGDAGLLTAVRLSKLKYEVVAVSTKPCFLSGQGIGQRLVNVDGWKDHSKTSFERFRDLRGVEIVHGAATSVDLDKRQVSIAAAASADGKELVRDYDALVIATGTTNGFWRTADVETSEGIDAKLEQHASSLEQGSTIAVVGGGPSAVETASSLKEKHGDSKQVHLFYPRLLPGYGPKASERVAAILADRGVVLHPNHRAVTAGVDLRAIGNRGSIFWHQRPHPTERPCFVADKIVWAVGAVRPNTKFLPRELLDDRGFVTVTPHLNHPDRENVFAVGDVAASDPHRSTARNFGFVVVASNVDRYLTETAASCCGGWFGYRRKIKSFKAPEHRWGSILGLQRDGMRVFSPTGRPFLIRKRFYESFVLPVVVRTGIYKGVDRPAETSPKTTTPPTEEASAS